MHHIRQYLITPTKENNASLLEDYQALDCSWHLPSEATNGLDDFKHRRLPKALFFDIDIASQPNAPFPHTLPSKEYFYSYCKGLGLDKDSSILLYDNRGVICAFRVWYMMREFGFNNVAILDGGLRYWDSLGFPIETSTQPPKQPSINFEKQTKQADDIETSHENFCFTDHLLQKPSLQVIDARAEARYLGQVAEPRAGVRSGHIPGAKNIPYLSLFDDNGCLKDEQELNDIFDAKHIDLENEITTSCGSGVTASIVAFALQSVGAKNVKIYDGSWAEWGSRHELPISKDGA